MHLQLLLTSLSLTSLSFAAPQGPTPAAPARQCKRIPTDPEWPAPEAWKAAMPAVVARGPQGNPTRPDYSIEAFSVADVQAAVNFARTNNIRLTIVNSGHDFLGRNDAPTGLSLMVGDLKGAKVLQSFTPSEKGAESPDYEVGAVASANKITVLPGQQPAVTFGAGVSTQELHDVLAPSGLFTMGAAHGEVRTAGGWGQTAGHGPFTSVYGLGVDQVLEYKVVTADGELRVANAKVNQDLFWALRGGGGGTFGVVVEATVKAFPTPKITMTRFWLNATEVGSGRIFEAAAYLHSQFPEVNAKGMQGYYYTQENTLSATFLSIGEHGGVATANATWQPVLQKLASLPGITTPITSFLEYHTMKQWFDSAFGPIPAETHTEMPEEGGHSHGDTVGATEEPAGGHDHGEPTPATTAIAGGHDHAEPTPEATTMAGGHDHAEPAASGGHAHAQRDTYHLDPRSAHEPETLREFFKRHGPGGMMVLDGKRPMDSRLLWASHLKDPALAGALNATFPRMKYGVLRGHLIGGGAVLKEEDTETSVNPAWRKAYVHLISTGAEVPSISPVRDLSPLSGCYVNEASYNEPNWKQSMWGTHYPRLLSIKDKYDPTGLFWVTPGIGADAWSVQDGVRLCPATPSPAGPIEYPPANDNPNMRDPETEFRSSGAWPQNQTQADASTRGGQAALEAAWAAGAAPVVEAGGHDH
ncbi:FAD-binding domain-containing protein [Eremomyces bilateralis CBS 781.70]|uniref:FAD-binding domain-containing protein n=1 Tax=Eremomyces bilateralis CBS 781.70 TaxID=1392243 RepID=A0A6G1G4D0_9PEZI|nr:FAD-binding domain-containing protein [Eremomyces bilateralis CBS 781.70]KAF1812801.1 FAD-binding domain-containing protein [Eremomyces bilateralis CBS 781.70]